MNKIIWGISTLLLILSLAACSTAIPVPATPATSSAQSTAQASSVPAGVEKPTAGPTAYPFSEAPAEANPAYPAISSYPGPSGNNPQDNTILPTQDTAMGSLKGRLLENGKPVTHAMLYLAAVIKSQTGKEMATSYSRETSPSVQTDAEGNFEFRNVAPGRYGLVLDTVVNAYLLYYPGDKQPEILETVEAGKTTDVGELNYDDVPGN